MAGERVNASGFDLGKDHALRSSVLIKLAKAKARRLKKVQGWGEGDLIRIEGIDKKIRQTFDNVSSGKRYDPKYKNKFIRMLIRGK